MTPRSICGRVDLARALVEGGDDLLDAAAALVGYEKVPVRPKQKPEPSLPPPPEPTDVDGVSTAPIATVAPVPFWRLEAFESAASASAANQGPGGDADDAPIIWSPPVQPAAVAPLATWPAIMPRLRRVAAVFGEGHTVDINTAVARLSRGEWVDRLPRRRHRRWGTAAQIISDRSQRLVPFWEDQDRVVDAFGRHFPRGGLDLGRYWDSYAEPVLARLFHEEQRYALPPPGALVIVLGDLGAFDDRRYATMRVWEALGRRLKAAGCHPMALIPGASAHCPSSLRRFWTLVPWIWPTWPAVLSRRNREARAERLLRLVSPAVRVEPGFLRAVRLLLGAAWSDAVVEADVWQHPALSSASSVAATLDPNEAKRLRAAFESEPAPLQRRVLDLLRRWRVGLPQEIWLEECLSLGHRGRQALPDPGDVDLARRFFGQLGRPGRISTGALDWSVRVERRLPENARRDPVAAAGFNRLWHAAHRDNSAQPPPPGFDPADLEISVGSPRRYAIMQHGPELILAPWEDKGLAEGQSPLGLLTSASGLLSLESVQFWKSGWAPAWASGFGVDEYGLWATFKVSGADGKSVTQRMRWISPGKFMMGSPESEAGRYEHESPRHEVILSRGYWLFDTPCTQELWKAVMRENPSRFQDPRRPVEQVSWDEVQEFLKRINEQVEGLALVLPSEAQWEYACRAGTETATYAGDLDILGENNTPVLDGIAWYGGNSGWDFDLAEGHDSSDWKEKQYPHRQAGTRRVAEKQPNSWGLYDMLGNVWEWCAHSQRKYDREPVMDPIGQIEGAGLRVLRGGSWFSFARSVRAACRHERPPDDRYVLIGFRCARVQVGAEPAGLSPLRLAERRRATATSGGAERVQLELETTSAVSCQLPAVSGFLLLGDREHLEFGRIIKPRWATAIGRDRFGLWTEFEIEGERYPPVTQRMRWISPGKFMTGSPGDEAGRYEDESPRHEVTLSRGYWLFDTPCTQGLWETVMGENPSEFQDPRRPAEQVSWDKVQEFITRINGRVEELALVLPSEAQWEYACRAGTETATYAGDLKILGENNAPVLDEIAWYGGNSGRDFDLEEGYDSSGWKEKQYPHTRAGTRRVGEKQPNGWGLYDMLGNVWEWCADGQRDYGREPVTDPIGRLEGAGNRVLRGGSWLRLARFVRAACRYVSPPVNRLDSIGFRCARVQD